MRVRNQCTEIDTRDPQFAEWELRRAAGRSGGTFLLTIKRLYEGRGLSVQSWVRATNDIRAAVKAQAKEATQRYHAFVLVSPAGNISARTYLGRDEAETAAAFSDGSQVVDLFGGAGIIDNWVTPYFLGLFPGNDLLVDALLRRWARQIRHTSNTPASRAAAITKGRQTLVDRARWRAEAEAWVAAHDSQALPV